MKAITLENKKLAVKEIRGSFVYYLNEKGQVKCTQSCNVEIIEVEENEIFGSKKSSPKTKKLNAANFMSKEEYAKSKYSTMSDEDFAEERRLDALNCKSY